MKTSLRPILLLCSVFVLFGLQSCKDQATEEADNSRRLTSTKLDENKVVVERESSSRSYRGEFLYVADAAVLKGEDFIYAVKLDSMSMALAERVKELRADLGLRALRQRVPELLRGERSQERRVGKEWRSRWSPYH